VEEKDRDFYLKKLRKLNQDGWITDILANKPVKISTFLKERCRFYGSDGLKKLFTANQLAV
jgi:hypothetical protein